MLRNFLRIFFGLWLASSLAEAGTWVPLNHLAPDFIDFIRLLSDGTVVGANGASGWYRLTPDASGSYINGTWSTLASTAGTRLYYSSQLLTNGQLFVAGGEYGTGTDSGELYDPLANTWTLLPDAEVGFVDSVSQMLPNGKVLIAPVIPFQIGGTILFDPASNAWETGPQLFRGFDQDEASWLKLPDTSILTIDPYGTNSERYIPSLNKWVNDAIVPVTMYDVNGELGAAFLLPSGKAFFIGATGNTAFYTPTGTTNPGTWAAGPVLPNHQGTPDAPAAMMPNGKILCATSHAGSAENAFPSPTSFYEYDPVANSFAQVSGPTGNSLSGPSYTKAMLDLPDGNVLLSDFGDQLYVYEPGGTPLAAGQPVISSITTNSTAGSYQLTGTQLNGISEGAAYGDDEQMNSNYPLVRMTNSAGQVYYARTYNWNNTGVMTGSTPVTTQFTLPTNLLGGAYSLVVVANGIASAPVTFTPEPLFVTPFNGFAATGLPGGPFSATNQNYALTNLGTSSISWAAGFSASWLEVAPSNGTLTSGGSSANMAVSLSPAAAALTAGNYTGTVWVTNLNDGTAQSLAFNLTILPVLPIVPSNAVIFAGQGATFTVATNSGLTLSYQWFNGANPISGATNPVYTVTSAAAGVYALSCSAADSAGGSVTGSASLTAVFPSAYQQAVLAFNPVGYWPLAETNGSIAYDYVGGNNGFYSNNCTLGVTGLPYSGLPFPNYACHFDGNSAYVVIPQTPLNETLDLTNSMTMVAWILPSSAKPTNYETFFGHGFSSYEMDYDTTGHVEFYNDDSGAVSPSAIYNGNWHQVVGVYNNNNGNLYLYIDGSLVETEAGGGTPAGSDDDVWLGGNPEYPVEYLFKGAVCQAALFSTALSATQVQSIYTAAVSANSGSSVQFTGTPTNGVVPLTVQFMASAIDNGNNAITAWNWSFGDGSTGTGQNPLHVYTSPGSFQPTLVATNSLGNLDFGSGLSITASLPTLAFTASATNGTAPLTVQFSSPDVDSGDNTITSWNWSFGDGSTGAGQTLSYTYTVPGTYTPSLAATNNLGFEDMATGPSITVSAPPFSSGLVVNGGFETGDFTGWALFGGDPSDNFVDNGFRSHINPLSGTYVAALGSSGSLSYLSQSIPTTAGLQYALSLWLNSPDGLGPNQFMVSWNGNTLFNQTNIAAIGWTNLQFFVPANAASTVLQFGFQDNPTYLGLDNVSVVAAQPGIASVTRSNASLVLNGVNGQPGWTYYVLSTTNLALPVSQWTPVASNVLSAGGNFSIIATNAVTQSVPQQFFILQAQ